jgi:predicted regulator of Ras-like GTPase activity (Roadblock/LC7/MglB family)
VRRTCHTLVEADVNENSRDRIRDVLRSLLGISPYMKAAALVRVSGLAVMSFMPDDVEQERVAAMSAVMLLLGERITGSLRSGALDKVYIKGDEGHIVLMAVGREAMLTVMAEEHAPLGLLFVEMRRAAERLKKLVKEI